MIDLISRQDAIDALGDEPEVWTDKDEYAQGLNNQWHYDRNAILGCPSADLDLDSYSTRLWKAAYKRGKRDTEPKRGKSKWIYGEHDVAMCDGYWCEKCKFFVPWDYQHKFIDFIKDYNFCPNCGADMRGEQDEEP